MAQGLRLEGKKGKVMITIYIGIILYLFMGVMIIIACHKDIKNKETSEFFDKILDYSQLAAHLSLFPIFIEFLIRYLFQWR